MTRTTTTAPTSAYLRAGLLAAGITAAAGIGAGLVRGDDFWLAAGVFGAAALGPALALGWLLFVSDHTVPQDAHAEDSVERRWAEQAGAGAFLDVVIASGVTLTLLSVLDVGISATGVLTLLVVLALADSAVRYAVVSRRGA